jgi:imidazolonepropionase-like amidohydrolase
VLKNSRLARFTLLLLIGAATAAPAVNADDRASVVIRDVSVLQPSAGGWLTHRDVVIRNTTISALQPTGGNLPLAKVVINGDGKFVIPGLFDNRVHLAQMTRETAGRFVAYGVTSVRDAGDESPQITEWRREISHGKFMGPRILETAGRARGQNDLIPGSNAGTAAIAPGQSLHDALTQLVTGGLKPADALKRATIESARFHGREDLGTIADLLILNGDPLSDITHTRALDAVVFRGEALTRAHLNLLLSKSQAAEARR